MGLDKIEKDNPHAQNIIDLLNQWYLK